MRKPSLLRAESQRSPDGHRGDKEFKAAEDAEKLGANAVIGIRYPPTQKTILPRRYVGTGWMNAQGGPAEEAGASADSAEEMKDTTSNAFGVELHNEMWYGTAVVVKPV